MAVVEFNVQNRIVTPPPGLVLITHNPTDSIKFIFDDEWTEHPARTARFAWYDGFIDVPFIGDIAQAPEIPGVATLYVGVYSDGITSAPAKVSCKLSIKSYGASQADPTPDVYDQIIALITAGIPVYFEDLTEAQKEQLISEFSDDVAALKMFAGTGPLSTIAQTLAGAVNELVGRANTLQTAIGGFSFELDSTDGGLNIIYTYE